MLALEIRQDARFREVSTDNKPVVAHAGLFYAIFILHILRGIQDTVLILESMIGRDNKLVDAVISSYFCNELGDLRNRLARCRRRLVLARLLVSAFVDYIVVNI